jgi:hypothetical protein
MSHPGTKAEYQRSVRKTNNWRRLLTEEELEEIKKLQKFQYPTDASTPEESILRIRQLVKQQKKHSED